MKVKESSFCGISLSLMIRSDVTPASIFGEAGPVVPEYQKRLLDKGKIEKLVAAIRSIVSSNPDVVKKIRSEADNFERNAARMRYPKFR